MFNSKFWLLVFFGILFPVLCFGYNNFQEKYSQIKPSNRIAINNLKFIQTKENYSHYFQEEILEHALKCFKKYRQYFNKAEKKYGVSKYIILSILIVENHCGKYVPKYNLVQVYKTLIELYKNKKFQKKIYNIFKSKFPEITPKWFYKRVKKKYLWASKHLKALKVIYKKENIDIFKIKSSWAGAFGFPQFLPYTFLNYAVDGNGDGKIDLYTFSDSIFSIANYLYKNGWKKDLRRKVIFRYNHSKLYVDTVIKLSKILKEKGE